MSHTKLAFFLVASRGYMATSWLTNALNTLPGTVAIHGNSPETTSLDSRMPLGDRLESISFINPHMKPLDRCGFVHCVNANMIIDAVRHNQLGGVRPSLTHLFRHPIMLAEAKASNMMREIGKSKKYQNIARAMIEEVKKNRCFKAENIHWPKSVHTRIDEADPKSIARLAGIWSRLLDEASETLGLEVLALVHGKDPSNSPFSKSFTAKYENYTTDFENFYKLIEHIGGKALPEEIVHKAFSSPRVNKSRTSSVTDPDIVYRNWNQAEQDLFNTILSVTGLRYFFQTKAGYSFPETNIDEAVYDIPSRALYSANGIMMNVAAISTSLDKLLHQLQHS